LHLQAAYTQSHASKNRYQGFWGAVVKDDLLPGILSPCSRPQARQDLAGWDPNGTHAQVEQKAQAKGKEDEWKKKGPKGHEEGY
jgi:hypothetical protein